MAVAFGSISTQYDNGNDGSIVITKPTGLAEGDFMIACIYNGDTADTATLTGWTSLATLNDGGNSRFTILYKVASAGDAAASNFAFTTGGNVISGTITRITGASFSGADNIVYDLDFDNGASTTQTFTGGVTPAVANSLLLMGGTNNANITMSGYTVATDDPTWTERADFGGGSPAATLSQASAIRTATSATGDYTITYSAAAGNAYGYILSISESVNVSVNADLLTGTLNLLAPTVSADANVTAGLNTATFSILAPTVTTQTVDWTYESRPVDSVWTIEDQI